MNQIDMQRSADPFRNEFLEKIMRPLPVDAGGKKSESSKHTAAVAVDRKNIPIEGVQKHATGDLRTNTGEFAKHLLGFSIAHQSKRR
jgi:hypothetical protein